MLSVLSGICARRNCISTEDDERSGRLKEAYGRSHQKIYNMVLDDL